MTHAPRDNSTKGFTIIETLIVVAIMATFTVIAIPLIGKMHSSAREATDRRNAQNLASVFATAQAAGLDFYVPGDKAATIDATADGGYVVDPGPFQNSYFGVPNMTAGERASAGAYLEVDDISARLIYVGL